MKKKVLWSEEIKTSLWGAVIQTTVCGWNVILLITRMPLSITWQLIKSKFINNVDIHTQFGVYWWIFTRCCLVPAVISSSDQFLWRTSEFFLMFSSLWVGLIILVLFHDLWFRSDCSLFCFVSKHGEGGDTVGMVALQLQGPGLESLPLRLHVLSLCVCGFSLGIPDSSHSPQI